MKSRAKLIAVAVAACSLWWLASLLLPPPDMGGGGRPVPDATPPESADGSAHPALPAADVERTVGTASVSGQVVWIGGAPAYGSEVWLDGADVAVAVDAVGAFELGSVPVSSRSLTIWVRPPCWRTAAKFEGLEVVVDGRDHRLTKPVALPLEGDVALAVDMTSEVSEALSRLAASGLRAEWTRQPAQGALPIPVRTRSDEFPFAAHTEALVRLPFGGDHRCSVLVDCGGGARLELAAQNVSVVQDRVAQCAIAVSADGVLAGEVVDHDGHALPHAFVEVLSRSTAVGDAGKVSRVPLELSPDGGFLFAGDPSEVHELVCRYEGVETRLADVRLGQTQQRVVVDLSSLRRFVLTKEGVGIEHFLIGTMFTREQLPEFQRYPGGRGWIRPRGVRVADWFALAWQEGGKVFEIRVPRPDVPGHEPYVIEATRYDLRPSGEIRLTFGGRRDVEVRLTRVEPTSQWEDAVPWRTFGAGQDRHLLGILPGKYSVEVEVRRPGELPVHYQRMVSVSGDVVDVDVVAIIDAR